MEYCLARDLHIQPSEVENLFYYEARSFVDLLNRDAKERKRMAEERATGRKMVDLASYIPPS